MLSVAQPPADRPAAAPILQKAQAPREMSFVLAVTLTCAFTIFGLAACFLVGWIYDAPALTMAVLVVSALGALRRPRSSRRSRSR